MTNYEQVRNVNKPAAATQKQQQPSRRTDPGLTRQQHPAAIIQRATTAPESLTTADVLQLQRTIGNRAVGQLLSGIGAAQREPADHGSLIQAKLTINPPGDVYEQEADRVAGQVVDRINQPASQPAGQGQAVQRQEVPEEEELLQGKMIQRQPEEEEELLQGKMIDTIQRQDIPEEEEELQMMPIVQRAPGGGIAAAPDLEATIQRARGSGQPLSRGIRAPMEQAFGADFGGVRVHTDTESDLLNRSIQARAFTTGHDVFFRQGAYDPGSRSGQELLAHELTHVVQQNERVSMRHDRLNVVDKFDEITERARAVPESITSADLLQLQRTIGNQDAGRLISEIGTAQRQPDRWLAATPGLEGAIQRQYTPLTHQYGGRPAWPGAFPGVAGWQARHHQMPWSNLRDDILNKALGAPVNDLRDSLIVVVNLAKSGVRVNNTVKNGRKKNTPAFTTLINQLAEDLHARPENLFIGPDPNNRTDDPGDGGPDHHMKDHPWGEEYEESKKFSDLAAKSKGTLSSMKSAVNGIPKLRAAPAPYIEDEWTWNDGGIVNRDPNTPVAVANRRNWSIRYPKRG